MFTKRLLYPLFAALLVALVLAGCNKGDTAPPSAPAAAEATQAPTQAPTKAPTPTPQPTAEETQPPALVVEDVNTYSDGGYWKTVGILTNYTDKTWGGIEFAITVLDSDGKTVLTDTAYLLVDHIAPGESMPFAWWGGTDLPENPQVEVDVVAKEESDLPRSRLDVENTRVATTDEGDIYITGELVNNTDHPVMAGDVAAAVFSGGHILDADYADVNVDYYAPGERGPFLISFDATPELVDQMDDFAIYVDAQNTDEITPWEIRFESDYRYVDTWGSMHLVGEITNLDDEDTLDVRLVAAYYNANGEVLDVDYTDLPLLLEPGDTGPYDMDNWAVFYDIPDTLDMIADYTIQVDLGWTFTMNPDAIPLDYKLNDVTIEDNTATFTGTVTNNSGDDADSARVVIGMRDAEGKLVALGSTFLFDPIPNGESADFEIDINLDPALDPNTLENFVIVVGNRP